MFSLDATAEFPLGDRAGLVAFACAAGCGWPETKASISHVRAFTKAEWRLGKRAPHGVTLLPERYATLQPIELPKIPSRVCGFSPTFLTTDKCKLKERPLIAYRYKPKQLAVITMCSAFHFGSWIDIPPLTSKAFERIKARRAERA